MGGLAETRGVVKLSNAGGEKNSWKNYYKVSDVVSYKSAYCLLCSGVCQCHNQWTISFFQSENLFKWKMATRVQGSSEADGEGGDVMAEVEKERGEQGSKVKQREMGVMA